MTSDGRSTRWQQHRAARRQEIVEATLRAIRLHGAGVGMDEIAATAGTSKTVLYRHFTDRSGLYAAVAERVDALIVHDVALALGVPTGSPPGSALPGRPRDLVAAAIDAYLRLVQRDPEVYRFIVTAPLLERPSDGDPAQGVTGHVAAELASVLAPALARAGQDRSVTAVWSHGLVGMVRAAADRWLADPQGMPPEELAEHLTALAWSGLSQAFPAAAGSRRRPGEPRARSR